jgi:hypothetical protein
MTHWGAVVQKNKQTFQLNLKTTNFRKLLCLRETFSLFCYEDLTLEVCPTI